MATKKGNGGKRMGPVRPQIMMALITATVFSIFGIWVGMEMAAVEVVTAIIGAYMGFVGGVSLKVLESE